ncbi:uncharacterized protein LOC126850204 [Cataglyphis hispanica]|uniref:uncharacterized protein LOC126850204 n=1 Tax=Cataglyphis hispanica TaxID=1086592 RepID=UPI00217FA8D1|nr:uncharacterized protein LOC126850204 [Cataglyphis hispanica]
MKVPILIFCLTVIFGNISCRIYSKENVNLIEGTNDKYQDSYFNVPLERSLSRYKRASILFPITSMGNLMGFGSNGLIKNILHVVKIITGLLTNQEDLCSTEKLSIDLIEKIQDPIKTIEIILCQIFNVIGQESREIVLTLLKISWEFLSTIFLPGLHTVLNQIAKTGILPPNLIALIETFNVLYKVLQS